MWQTYGFEESRKKGEVFLEAYAALAASSSGVNLGSSIVMYDVGS